MTLSRFLLLMFFLVPMAGTARAETGTPLEISAATSLEWNRPKKTYTARGSAVAKKGNLSIAADTLTAHYSDGKAGSKISRVEAVTGVVVESAPYRAYGDLGTYDMASGLATLTGKDLKVETATETMTGADKIEFNDAQNTLIATGSPVISRGTDTLTAKTLTLTFKTGEDGSRKADTFKATGGITLKTARETLTGDTATYDIGQGKATVNGHIRIAQGESVIEGTKADIDLATGISKLYADEKLNNGRVKGVFYPGKSE